MDHSRTFLPASRDAAVLSCGDSVLPSAVELLRAIAVILRGTQSAWAPVGALAQRLNTSRGAILDVAQRYDWCTHINGYICAKAQDALFQASPRVLINWPRDMFALARAITSATQPLVPRRVLVRWL